MQRDEPDGDGLVHAGATHVRRPHRRPDSSRRQSIGLHREHRALLVRRPRGGRQVLEVSERTRTLASLVEDLADKDLRPHILRLEPKSRLGLRHRLVELSLLPRQQGQSKEHEGEAALLHAVERRDHGERPLVGADGLVPLSQAQSALRFEQDDRHGRQRETVPRKPRPGFAHHGIELPCIEELGDVRDVRPHLFARAFIRRGRLCPTTGDEDRSRHGGHDESNAEDAEGRAW